MWPAQGRRPSAQLLPGRAGRAAGPGRRHHASGGPAEVPGREAGKSN